MYKKKTIKEVGKMALKVGDKVRANMDVEIKKATKGKKKDRKSLEIISLWQALNGKTGIISQLVSDDEIWVRGDDHNTERMFNKNILEKIE